MAVHRSGDVEEVRRVLAARVPHYRMDSVVLVGEGLDSVAYQVNDKLIVRFSKRPDPKRLDREVRLLALISGISPLPIPEPAFVVAELGCIAYGKLAGTSLLDLALPTRSSQDASIAATLGEFLAVLHAVPVDRMADLVDTDDQPLAEWRRLAAETYPTVASQIPAPHRRRVEAFLDAAAPDGEWAPVFSHNDLGIEHVLVDPALWTVTGIIDWSDAAIVDPAHDFGRLYRDLGPGALAAAIDSYRNHPHDLAATHCLAALGDRAAFYARCGVLEDLAYGLETSRSKYVEKSLAAMEWLFPG